VLAAAAFLSGGIQLLWTLARSTPAILVYDAMYGIVSGAYGASVNPGAASFAPHTNQAGLYLGMCFFSTSWFWLAGTPVAAQLIDKYGYLAASMFTGSVVLLGGACVFVSRVVRARQVGSQWV
jgi:ATP/ADP translocase